ncbi:MAG: efflux transporter outer membrane subunit [Parvularculaceae bacterium]
MRAAVVPLVAGRLLSGCVAVGPDHQPPDAASLAGGEEGFRFARAYAAEAPLADWWTAFDDQWLDALVARGAAENRTLAIAAANLRAARAARGVARLNRLPTDNAFARYQETRSSAVQLAGVGIGGDQVDPNDNIDFTDLGVSAAWEVDLFGRVTRLIEAATADADAAQAALDDVRATIAADIADAYVFLQGLQAQRAVASRNAENLQRTLDLVRELRGVGRVTDLDVDQARAQLLISEAAIPAFDADIAETASRLGVLVGASPSEGIELVADDAPLHLVTEEIAVGDPSSLLRRRPDVAAAERRLAAATARIGLNVAEAFPRIDLLGDVGVRAIGFEDVFAPTALNFAVGPQISWSATDLLRARDRVEGAEAAAAGALAAYEQTVLTALQETETALARQARAQERYAKLAAAEEAAGAAADVARLRYEAGRVDFLQVLDAERVALTTANDAAAARTDIARAQIEVFRALRAGAPAPAAAE